MQGVKRKGKRCASSANSWVAGIRAIRGEKRLAVHGLWLLNCMAAKQKNIDEKENIGTCAANYMVFKKEIDKETERWKMDRRASTWYGLLCRGSDLSS